MDDRRNIVLIQPQPGKADRTHDLYKISGELGALCGVLLALHAFTGCDTTSAPFRKGKNKLPSSARDSRSVRRRLHICNQSDPDYAAVAQAGEALVTDMYDVMSFKSLDHARFFRLKQITARNKTSTVTNLALLPPTSGAARMHAFGVYLQVQLWYGRDMDPLKWRWEMQAGNLQPIGSERPAAPPRLLKIIFCEDKSGCKERSACSCRSAGQFVLPCAASASVCRALTLMHQICQNRCLWLGLVRPTLRS